MKITKRQLRRIIAEEKSRLAEQFTGDPVSTSSKILDDMVDKLESDLISKYRLDPEEVDAALIALMNTAGSSIETLLVKLLGGGFAGKDY